MIPKVIDLPERFHTGEPTLIVLATDYKGKWLTEKTARYREKTASPAFDYIKSIHPEPGNSIILVNAVAAFEAYDDNRNGDAFPAKPYMVGHRAKCGHEKCMDHLDGWINSEEVLTQHYKTFEQFGRVFKHHCHPAGTLVQMADGSRKEIQDVKIDDEVITLNGPCSVINTMCRPYKGDGVRLELRGRIENLVATNEHPVLVYRRDQVFCSHGYSRLSKTNHGSHCKSWREEIGSPSWVAINTITPGDCLVFPKPTHGEEEVSPEFAELVGWVASEGYLGDHGNIQFTFSDKGEDAALVADCLRRNGLYVGIHPIPEHNTVMLSSCNKVLHEKLSTYVKGTKSNKTLTKKVFSWNRKALLRLMGAYISGDGCVTKEGRGAGIMRIRSSSRSMLSALSDILFSLDMNPAVVWDVQPGYMTSPTNGKDYCHNGSGVVSVTNEEAETVCTYSRKKPPSGEHKVPRGFLINEHVLVTVTNREDIELEENVFNIEVDGAHHYVANEVISHNCNKDPLKSFGDVLQAFWNDRMQRVELLLRLTNSKNPELIDQIQSGEYPAVSMGCSIAGTRVTLSDGRRKNIEDITIDDEVMTHLGRGRKVFQLHQRNYKGTIYSVKPEAGKVIHVTHEHPLLVVEAKHVRELRKDKGYSVWSDNPKVVTTWKLAEELKVGEHYLLQPINRCVSTPDYVTDALARLVGYYLAEGSSVYNHKKEVAGFSISCHKDDEVLKEIDSLTDALYVRRARVYPHPKSAVSRVINVYDKRLGKLLRSLCGKGEHAKGKFIDASVMLWEPRLQRKLLGAYANGDGHGTPTGSLTLSTSSTTLADQWLAMLPRMGLLGCVATLKHKAGTGFNNHETIEYVVNIGARYAQSLQDVCSKVVNHKPKIKKESRKIIGDYVVIPIRRIDAQAVEIPVFNFEVEEDNTYLTEGVVSHNCHVRWDVCTVCGHRAATRNDYCEHVDLDMRKIDPITGKRHCVLNPSPRFFDISMVRRPAETTGYMMKKVAHESSSGWRASIEKSEKIALLERKQASIRKMSDIQKELVGDVLAKKVVPDLELFRKYRREVLPGAAEAFESIPDSTLMSMSEHGLPTAMATVAEKGAALTAGEFTRLVFITEKVAIAPEHLVRVAAAQPLVREVLAQYPELLEEAGKAFLDARPSKSLGDKIASWAEKRATLGEWLRQKFHDTGLPFVGRGASMGPGYAYGAREPAKTDLMTMTDPATGAVYKTTRGASQAAADQNYRSLLGKAVLMHGAYSLAGMPMVISIPLGYQTSKSLHTALHPYYGVSYQTDQGPVLAGNTEFVKSSCLGVPATTAMNKLAFDYLEISTKGEAGVLASLPNKLATAFRSENLSSKVALLFESDEIESDESPTISFEVCARKLGALLVA